MKLYRSTLRNALPVLLTLVLAGVVAPVLGETVYQYIDRHGATTFSDTRPTHTDDYIEIQVDATPPPDATELEKNIDDMVAVAEKLEQKRRADEEARAAAEAAANRREPEAIHYPVPDDGGGYLGYRWPGYYRHPARTPKAAPPVRYRNIDDPVGRRLEDLRKPLRIPGFNTGGSFSERMQPFDPPPARQRPPR